MKYFTLPKNEYFRKMSRSEAYSLKIVHFIKKCDVILDYKYDIASIFSNILYIFLKFHKLF